MGMPSGEVKLNNHGKDSDHDHEKSPPAANNGY